MAKRELCPVTVLSFLCVCNFAVVHVSALAATGQTAENVVTSCAAVKPIFEMKNISVDIPDTPVNGLSLNVCTAERSCCSPQMEQALLRLVRNDFESLLHHNSRSLQGLLVSAADTVREHVSELLRQSENRTLSLLSVVLPRSPSAARAPVSRLYSRLVSQLERPLGAARQEAESLEESVSGAFWRLFPLVYRQTLSARRSGASAQRELSADYAACLSAAAPELEPFGGAPSRLARALRRALTAAALLRQALLQGAAVLADADRLLTANPGGAESWRRCERSLLRMSYCSRCGGLSGQAKPCAGLCLNVVRGCLTQHAAELDLPWNGYVDAAERLAATVRAPHPLEDALRSIDAHVAEAIIIAMEARPGLDRKVKLSCGPYRWATVSENTEAAGGGGGSAEVAAGGGGGGEAAQAEQPAAAAHGAAADTLSSKLQPFLASLSKSRGFYANLAESLCSDESFAETRDTADCWNGQRIGEYTKTVVASSIPAQKYNPEVAWTPHQPDMRIAELSDQLRHIKQVVVSQVSEAPSALALTRYEGGSGSGQQPGDSWDDEADSAEAWPDQGSGSGDAPIVPEVGGGRSATENVQVSPGVGADKPTPGSSAGRSAPPSWSLLVVALGATVTALCHRGG